MVTLKDLIRKADFELVWTELISFYPKISHLKEEFSTIYDFLLNKEANDNIEEMVIHIVRVDDADQDDYEDASESIGYEVCGKNNSPEWKGYWDLSLSAWGDWLGFYVHDEAFKVFTNEQIIALCLYEMTFYGLSEDEVLKYREAISLLNTDDARLLE